MHSVGLFLLLFRFPFHLSNMCTAQRTNGGVCDYRMTTNGQNECIIWHKLRFSFFVPRLPIQFRISISPRSTTTTKKKSWWLNVIKLSQPASWTSSLQCSLLDEYIFGSDFVNILWKYREKKFVRPISIIPFHLSFHWNRKQKLCRIQILNVTGQM